LRELADDSRVTVRRGGEPKRDGKCVVYWMQRAQRGWDNHAVDLAVKIGEALALPVVAYFAGISKYPNANLRHYAFMNRGLVDVEDDLAERRVGFVLRLEPRQQLEQFLEDVDAAFLVGDENPIRETERGGKCWLRGLRFHTGLWMRMLLCLQS
jgi:deoxyribodipyrimidine photo-lyase